MSSYLPRTGLFFVALTVVLGGLLASTPVFATPVALCIGANVASAFLAVRELRHRGGRASRGASRLRTGLFVGGVVALVSASAFVAPRFIAGGGLEPEVRLSVQLLVLSVGFAAALLAWWGSEYILSGDRREH